MVREHLDKTEAMNAGLQSNALYRLIIRISDVWLMKKAMREKQ